MRAREFLEHLDLGQDVIFKDGTGERQVEFRGEVDSGFFEHNRTVRVRLIYETYKGSEADERYKVGNVINAKAYQLSVVI